MARGWRYTIPSPANALLLFFCLCAPVIYFFSRLPARLCILFLSLLVFAFAFCIFSPFLFVVFFPRLLCFVLFFYALVGVFL